MHVRSLPLTATALTATAALLLAACSGADSTDDTKNARPAPSDGAAGATGVVSRAGAHRIVDRYEKVNNAANKTRNARLLATVEGGNLLERSSAAYEQFETLSAKEQKAYVKPFFYQERRFLIPARGEADWFMFIGRSNNSTGAGRSVHVFDKSRDGWRMTVSVPAGTDFPKIATGADGLATPVAATARTGPHTPADIPDAYEDLWSTGGRKEGRILADNKVAREAREGYRDRNDGWDPRQAGRFFLRSEPEHRDTYALKTAEGGALAVVPLAHQQVSRVLSGGLEITPDAEGKIYDPRPRPVVIDDFHGQALAHLPATGKPRVLSARYEFVDSH
ncbi:hypothetical protein [Streptomyces longisporoflavus]|uniref:hypothetical protein n=1 Tax=Streptomyces longisporoflavus TaxID=28044 RepID=UPI00167E9A85|nr:hypothetical protein [Streptomyces longisporoflavus]